jgi:cyclophilin family peptidyl-prolyl cis-trans isomerase
MALPIDDASSSSSTHNINNTDDIEEMQPQFFISTDEAPYLNGKHVIFGTVVGPTIFNVIRINQYGGLTPGMVGENSDDRSNTKIFDTNDSSVPRIISTKIVTNPFEQSMIPKALVTIPWRRSEEEVMSSTHSNATKKKKNRKGKFDINVLSFGDEIDRDIAPTATAKKKTLDIDHSILLQHVAEEAPNDKEIIVAPKSVATAETIIDYRLNEKERYSDGAQVSHDRPIEYIETILPTEESQSESNNSNIEPASTKPMSAVEAHRAKYLSKKQKRENTNNSISSKQQRDDETYNKLLHFRRKIHDIAFQSKNDSTTTTAGNVPPLDNSLAARMARRAQQEVEEKERQKKLHDINYDDHDPRNPSYHGQILNHDNDDEDDPYRWIQTKFVCKKHMDLMSGDNKDAMEEYEIIDPKQKNYKERPRK